MKIVEQVLVGGDKISASNSGKVAINQTTGDITFRDATTNQITARLNSSGYRQYRVDGETTLMTLDGTGMTYSETDGTRRVRIGAHPADGHIGTWVTEPGIDVVEALGGE